MSQDVLFGRGPAINAHPGNQKLRALVNSQKQNFLNAQTKKQKRAIATLVFNEIQSLQPPGRFLVEDSGLGPAKFINESFAYSSSNVHPTILSKTWVCVEPEKALVKVMHRMREKDKEEKGDATQPEGGLGEFHSQKWQIPSTASREVTIGDAFDVQVDNSERDSTSLQEGNAMNEIQSQRAHQISLSLDDFILSSQTNPLLRDFQTLSCTSTEQQSSESSIIVRSGVATETKSGYCSSANLRNYLEGSGLDFGADFLFQDSNSQIDLDSSQLLREYTCRQWITNTKLEIDSTTDIYKKSSNAAAKYTKSALFIALKLTECILEAEKDERNGYGNPIPLDSITTENVMIRAKTKHHGVGGSDEAHEMIEFVWVMSFVGDDSATGTVMARLFAVGAVLYELFSMNAVIMDDDVPANQIALFDSININIEAEVEYPSQKKTRWWSKYHDDNKISNCFADLESNGIPWSLCALIGNLLECRHDPFCEDDAYTTFDDLRVDLNLMVKNPSCFLDNIHISNIRKLEVPDKLYGRDEELMKLDELYKRHITGRTFNGTIISGTAGVGKSKFAMHLQKLANQSNGHFLLAKFEQHRMSLKPLSTIANMFDSLCEMMYNDSSYSQLTEIEKNLTSALGSQPNLLRVVPNLRKLMPSCENIESSANNCVDNAVSMRYLCGELLRVISSYSKPITIVIDDIQFADHASLQLVESLLLSAQGAPVFFCLCHRDDEVLMSGPFNKWLTKISEFSLESIKLQSITPDALNKIMSEAMHLSPRLTQPLSSIVYHKTRGNPLFLRQLLDSLTEQGYIFIDMKQRRWAWDLDKIMELEISDDVLALLISDIQRLPSDLQRGLQVAACIGSCVTESMLNYLLIDLGFNLKDTLRQASEKGFMIENAGSATFRFAHDKIWQAAYELMPEQQRRENHMRLGLALCIQTLGNNVEDDELFFSAVNQINLGGPIAVHDPSQKNIIAELNLKAGRRSIELSDYNIAFKLFQHGISFFEDNHWLVNYQLSLDLFDAAADAALILNRLSEVTYYSNEVVSHSRRFDDKLLCKFCLSCAIVLMPCIILIVAIFPLQCFRLVHFSEGTSKRLLLPAVC